MYLAPIFPWGLIGPTKSIAHFLKGCNVICGFKGISSLRDGLPVRWHTSHALQYAFESWWRVGHHNLAHRIFYVVSLPEYHCNISSVPILNRCPTMTVKSATFTTNSFFCLIEYPFGAIHAVRKCIISSKWPSTTCTTISCASGNPSSKLVGSSPISMHERWFGPAFNHLGFTTTSKSYSWNNKIHL